MDDTTFLSGDTLPAPDTAPEATSLGELQMVREDCWREVHRLFHVERQSKAAIARWLDLDRKTVRTILRETVWRPYHRDERPDSSPGAFRDPVS